VDNNVDRTDFEVVDAVEENWSFLCELFKILGATKKFSKEEGLFWSIGVSSCNGFLAEGTLHAIVSSDKTFVSKPPLLPLESPILFATVDVLLE